MNPQSNGATTQAPHPYRGVLIVVEGIDGSGKSTQLHLLHRYLQSKNLSIHFTAWNSSELVRETMKAGKKKQLLTPSTFSLLHAVDFADRYYYEILPALKAGRTVLADRYVYTAFARDAARGVDPQWVRNLYSFAVKPDLALYFRVPITVSLDRLVQNRARIKYYEAGMDLGLSGDIYESYKLFQGRVLDEYERVSGESTVRVIDATDPIQKQQELVRKLADEVLENKTVRKVVA